jgi:hypothetical protein
MLTGRELVIALMLGVLLPAIIARPAFLANYTMRPHIRARWAYAYSVFAFAAAAFVYFSAAELLGRHASLSPAEKGALYGAGLLIFALLCAHHLPPILEARASAAARVAQPALAVCLGILMGGFFAADSLWPKAWDDTPAIALASWALALLATFAVSCWFSGFSPETQRRLFIWSRRRRRRQRRAGGRKRAHTPSSAARRERWSAP